MTDTAVGSSPLARGLPEVIVGRIGAAGIIPARAGFTQDWRRRARRRRDHPRSRGVYQPEETEAAYASGSSPLARGLPDGEGYVPFGGRIIPARAGFTRSTFSSKFATSGSSPLARGLPDRRRPRRRHRRIIPARAGFTRPTLRPVRTPRDHPRSRGVYRQFPRFRTSKVGSSPLARGLRANELKGWLDHGIIPARAGFTSSRRHPITVQRDHPRSRGVYRVLSLVNGTKRGSSPLARGLLQYSTRWLQWQRIIPARAGFTVTHLGRRVCPPDHPRSRGVYFGVASVETRGDGIIPARAGFTRAVLCAW